MKILSFRKFVLAASAMVVSVAFVGCEQKGPMEKAGENVDQAGKNIGDAINPKGPGEKAGENVDKALGK